jgi:uncharacterized protein YjiS (DUF1127 family)
MSATHVTGTTARLNLLIQCICSFFKQRWGAFQERRSRQKLRAALHELNDRFLADIGISRDEIEYVVSNPTVDPRYVGPGSPTIG